MSSTLAYLAIKGRSKFDVWSELSLTKSPTVSNTAEYDYCGSQLESDWYLVIDKTLNLWDESLIKKLSEGAHVLCCKIIETVNYAHVQEWKSGDLLWSVENNSDNYPGAVLTYSGEVPPEFAMLKQEAESECTELPAEGLDEDEQPEPEYVNIPSQLFCNIVGFNYWGESSLLPEEEILCLK